MKVQALRSDLAAARGKPPYVPTVLPIVWSMDYSHAGYSQNPFEVRCVAETPKLAVRDEEDACRCRANMAHIQILALAFR